MKDEWNAFMNQALNLNPTSTGKLTGRTFAVKDVYDIEGYTSSAGNPDWLTSHQPATKNAPVVDNLLKQGASLIGTTHTDELMYSLNGENFHYGTPINPAAPDRIPGGSSSGSAVAVAAGLVDFSLGTDTGGSVRIPSSYCGIYGFRPTHGVVNIDGVIPLSKSFDTVGWMAQDPNILLEVGRILIPGEEISVHGFSQLYFDKEAWSFVNEENSVELFNAIEALSGKNPTYIQVADEGLARWTELFRMIQGIEIWAEHNTWIECVHPTFGPGIAERFQWTSTLKQEELASCLKAKEKIKNSLGEMLKEDGLLVIPTAPGEAPLRHLPVDQMEDYRTKTMQLTCIAGLSGFPQVTIPVMKENGVPIGLSFIANQNQDLKLLQWVKDFSGVLRKKTNMEK